MTVLTSFSTPVAVGATVVYKAQIVDQNGAGIPAASLSALTLTLLDAVGGNVVNNVSAVNILNSGRGVVDTLGNLTVTLTAADTAAYGNLPRGWTQSRLMLIDWTYNGGNSAGHHQVGFLIQA